MENVLPFNKNCEDPALGKIVGLNGIPVGAEPQLIDLTGQPARRRTAEEAMQEVASAINRQCGVSDSGEPLEFEEQPEKPAAAPYSVQAFPDGDVFKCIPHPNNPALTILLDARNAAVAICHDAGVANLLADCVKTVMQAHLEMAAQNGEHRLPSEGVTEAVDGEVSIK